MYENVTDLVADISAVQSSLATGELTNIAAQEELNRIRKKALGVTPQMEIERGYRKDAVEQLITLRDLLSERDLQTIPDMELFHLSACCEMGREGVYKYFKMRNSRAAGLVCGEVDNG